MAGRRVIALLLNNAGLRDDYQGNLRRGVEQACFARDLDLWVYAGRTDFRASEAAQMRVFRLLSSGRVDGIVVAAGCIATANEVSELFEALARECSAPICSVGQIVQGVASLVVNNRRGSSELADHLVRDHGRRRFAYIGGPRGHEESEQRILGVRDALARHGLELGAEAVGHGDFMARSGAELAAELVASGRRFDAVMAANDDMARGALETLTAHGLRCPEDVVVVGFDDARNACMTRPALTTVRQPVARLGALAVARLAAAWRGHATSSTLTLATTVVARESCGCHPGRAVSLDLAPRGRRAERSSAGHVARLLAPVLEDHRHRRRWADVLFHALHAERRGEHGALPRALASLLAALGHPLMPTHELHRLLTGLRARMPAGPETPAIDASFHEAAALLAAEAARRDAFRSQRHEAMLEELRISGEQLATMLTLEAVAAALAARLPRFGIRHALVALYTDAAADTLVPLFALSDGRRVTLAREPYPAEQLVPDAVLRASARRSLTVLPLTFEQEQLGVAVLDLAPGCEETTLLREQLAAAIKTARLHEESLARERVRAQAQEERRVAAERLRSLQLIAGGVAHDLNNALGPLVILPEAILHDLEQQGPYPISDEVLEDLATIRQAGQRAATTIRDLLTLGQPMTLSMEPLDLNRLLREEAATLRALAAREPGVTLRIVTTERPLVTRVSKSHLLRALSNLVLNAIDAVGGKGTIAVRAFPWLVRERLEGVECVDAGSYAVVEVEDDGHGIPEDELTRVLEPFFTARRRAGSTGTGLGLTIVQRIVKEANGYLRVESELGRGATFGLYFPALVGRASSVSDKPPPPHGGRGRILVVDDEDSQLHAARRGLTQLGYEVATAISGDEALELHAAAGARFDLAIVDAMMPDGPRGAELAALLKQRQPALAIVLVSGWAPEGPREATGELRLTWLLKPYSVADLAAAVSKALGGNTTPSRPPHAASA